MLILTRRVGETLFIGDDIELTIIGLNGSQIRIGIRAPKEVRVDRAELRKRIEQEGIKGGPDSVMHP